MNFLAHCLLGHPHDALVAGGVLGDFVKGPVPDTLPVDLQAGIRLHRRIDALSNRHPGIGVSVRRLDPDLRRVAPVLVDLIADHCLALSFDAYGPTSLETFQTDAYNAIGRYEAWFNPSAKRFYRRMKEANLLARYRDREVILRAMRYVLERLRHEHVMDRLALVFDDLDALQADFDEYFPDLMERAAGWKSENFLVG